MVVEPGQVVSGVTFAPHQFRELITWQRPSASNSDTTLPQESGGERRYTRASTCPTFSRPSTGYTGFQVDLGGRPPELLDGMAAECWTLLTWIAARYPEVGLSTLVMSNTFRHPSVVAKMGATLQELSGGRFALGYGAGWHEGEHSAFGLELFSPGERIDRMEEAIKVIKTLWSESPASFSGRYYSVNNAHAEPRPDPAPPIMIGGAGERKTLRVVAKHADWWNDVARPVAELQHKLNVLKSTAMKPAAIFTRSASRSQSGRSSTVTFEGVGAGRFKTVVGFDGHRRRSGIRA